MLCCDLFVVCGDCGLVLVLFVVDFVVTWFDLMFVAVYVVFGGILYFGLVVARGFVCVGFLWVRDLFCVTG